MQNVSSTHNGHEVALFNTCFNMQNAPLPMKHYLQTIFTLIVVLKLINTYSGMYSCWQTLVKLWQCHYFMSRAAALVGRRRKMFLWFHLVADKTASHTDFIILPEILKRPSECQLTLEWLPGLMMCPWKWKLLNTRQNNWLSFIHCQNWNEYSWSICSSFVRNGNFCVCFLQPRRSKLGPP